jgi:hypothetical protein
MQRRLACVEFDDLLLLEELGEILSLWERDNLALRSIVGWTEARIAA